MTKSINLKRLVLGALMAAIVYIFTIVVQIPISATGGYINLGDVAVLLCSYLLGGIYGAFAAGLGSALSDLSAGYTIYAPATFIIKFIMVIAANLISHYTFKNNRPISMILAGISSELIMIFGYFIFESIVLGLGISAFAGVFGNLIQSVICIVLANSTGLMLIKQLKGRLLESI